MTYNIVQGLLFGIGFCGAIIFFHFMWLASTWKTVKIQPVKKAARSVKPWPAQT